MLHASIHLVKILIKFIKFSTILCIAAAGLVGVAIKAEAKGVGKTQAYSEDALYVDELPPGGDVTLPSNYPVVIPRKTEVTLSSVTTPQAITLTSDEDTTSIIRITAAEQKTKVINLKPGMSAVYSFKAVNQVKLQVMAGDIRINSIHPLKVQK